MQPIDALTENDKNTIKNYLYAIGGSESAPIEQVLRVWNANKKTLFRAFGNRLTISKSITIEKNASSISHKLSAIYLPYTIWYDSDKAYAAIHYDKIKDHCKDEFVASIIHYWARKDYNTLDLFYISRIFCHENLIKGYITHLETDEPYKCKSFKCTIKNGMRTIRTLQKVIKATGYPHLDLFEQWCNKVNFINTNTGFKTKLVLSINPIDFMSMSDNESNWRSCMSWKNDGCYRAGTLEMMNSNVAIVAYLEGPQTFNIYDAEGNQYNIPNKTWRSLFYVHKKILLAGKSYPYYNKDISIEVLNWLRQLVKENLKWNYQFINQPYKDVQSLENNFYLRDFFDVDYDKRKKHHCIFVYTNGMYNDIIEAHDNYICCRNYVDHSIKLCLSGPATCICCGDVIATREDIYSYDDLGSSLICSLCRRDNACSICGNVHYHLPYRTKWGNFCSTDCMKDIKFFPKLNIAINEINYYKPNLSAIIIIAQKNLSYEDQKNIERTFKSLSGVNILDFIQWCKSKYGEDIKVYRIKKYLTDRFRNLFRSYDFGYDQYNHYDVLYGFNSTASEIEEIENWIEKTRTITPLTEYFKEGGINEISFTMNK